MFPKVEDENKFVNRIESLCQLYTNPEVLNGTIKATSSDEKTGIQAISHLKITPERKGVTKRVESEYKRNGTTCLIAGKDICTGKIISYNLGPTRTEKDYLNHIKSILWTFSGESYRNKIKV